MIYPAHIQAHHEIGKQRISKAGHTASLAMRRPFTWYQLFIVSRTIKRTQLIY
jgi:hypothetical protein